ncbi:MAG: hypothetical protein WCP08_16125 [Prolixibacteraceae bacterium]
MKNAIRIYGLFLLILCVTLIQGGCMFGPNHCEGEDPPMMPVYMQIPVRIHNISVEEVHIWVTGEPYYVDLSESIGPSNKLAPDETRYFEFGRRFNDELDNQPFTVNVGQNGRILQSITFSFCYTDFIHMEEKGFEVYYRGRAEGQFVVEWFPFTYDKYFHP